MSSDDPTISHRVLNMFTISKFFGEFGIESRRQNDWFNDKPIYNLMSLQGKTLQIIDGFVTLIDGYISFQEIINEEEKVA